MEISREEALNSLRRWKHSGTTVGLIFAAHGGTAGSAMLAEIAELSSRIVFKTEMSVLTFGLFQAHFELRPLTVLRFPKREGLAQIDGLHIWLESGHWLFVCDARGLGNKWLESAARALERGGPDDPVESRGASRPERSQTAA